MLITLNGTKVEAEEGITLLQFVKLKGLEPERIVIEYNTEIAGRADWDRIVLKEGDSLEVLRFVGGG